MIIIGYKPPILRMRPIDLPEVFGRYAIYRDDRPNGLWAIVVDTHKLFSSATLINPRLHVDAFEKRFKRQLKLYGLALPGANGFMFFKPRLGNYAPTVATSMPSVYHPAVIAPRKFVKGFAGFLWLYN